ncbi:TadE family type IV pilus minor pilin [Streptomyces sp. enrichment culture]|uniref:TadE family type IV pilus minor pilin n=1 Tax=Streptomyces sp. enrichment culture TaxID=1795815 RepID=UPI003F571254
MTAETAVVLPVLVAFALALVWGLLVMAAQIQCVDAARTGARAAARQDPDDAVLALAREAAPGGARVTVGREAELVRVVVVAQPPVLHGLPFEVRAEAVASAEQAVGTDQPVGVAVGAEESVGAAQVAGAEEVVGAEEVAGADS